jgi:hypothetical protein
MVSTGMKTRRFALVALATCGSLCVLAPAALAGQKKGKHHTPTPPATVYTGRAYDASVALSAFGQAQVIGPINDTGQVSTTATTSKTTPVLPIVGSLLNASILSTSQTTGNGSSTFKAQVGQESVGGSLAIPGLGNLLGTLLGGLSLPTLPVVFSNQVTASSSTKCNRSGGVSSTGSTSIAYLKIGDTVVVGNGGLYAPNYTFTPNFTINLVSSLGFLKVVINEQKPIQDGLAVNAVDVTANLADAASAQVIVAHAESDVQCCDS